MKPYNYRCARWLVRPILLLAALAAAIVAIPAHADTPTPNSAAVGAAAVAKPDIFDVIERARQALLADKYEEAGKALDEVLKMPELEELDESVQFRVFLFAALAARGREDYLGAHEFIVIATKFPEADADHFLLRARYASWIEAWPDAGTALLAVGKTWPDALAKADPELIGTIAYRMNRDGQHKAERLELLNVLFNVKYTLEFGLQPDGLWEDLILDALTRNDLKRARELNRRVESVSTLMHMRIDRRYDALVAADASAFDLAAASERQLKRLSKVASANPRSLGARVQYGYALLEVGRFDDVLTLANTVIARVTAAAAKSPPYDDIPDNLNWIYNHKAAALRALGRWDEAIAVMEAGKREREQGSDNVSQAINLGSHYNDYGRPQDALKALDGIDWAHSLSPYGRMQLQHVRYRAFLQLGNASEADGVLAYLREHHEDAEDTWQYAMLDAGDLDGAAALLIGRLRDLEKRGAALEEIQDYKTLPRLPKMKESHDRWQALVARADVTAAVNEVGRRELHPLYSVPD
jgi:tetratricopeptide (TPR) repeat protein